MKSPDWSTVFEKVARRPGASEKEIQNLEATIFNPLTHEELEMALANGVPKDMGWALPTSRTLPNSYLDFLRWSNGGAFSRGRRVLDPVFASHQVREYLIAYGLPVWMPGALPFAFDGGGSFYLFDMRSEAVNDEYPIVLAHSSDLNWMDVTPIGQSFVEALSSEEAA